MTTKMKGLFKGLRYISQIFEEDKDQDMQIGFPTDVKHVAHIGWDGPSVENPSWMKDFKSQPGSQSAPLASPGDRDDNEIKWVSEDSRRGREMDSPGRDSPEVPKSSRRHHSADGTSNDSPRKKESSTKSRQPRRKESKDSSEGSVKSNRQPQESGQGSDSPSRDVPDIPKKSRRKKSKESVSAGGSTRSRSKATTSNGTYSDNGPDNESVPSINEEEKERRAVSKEY